MKRNSIILSIMLVFSSLGSSAIAQGKIYFSSRPSANSSAKILSFENGTLNTFKPSSGHSARGENQAAVSKDGKFIAFNTYHFGGWRSGYSKIDGSEIQIVDESRNYSFNPSFSPDNQWILFYAHASGRTGQRDIYKIKADGGEKIQLTKNAGNNYEPSWSPDGRKITFISSRSKNYEIYTMNSDGTGLKNISDHPNHDAAPSWSPDGKRIAFISIRGGYIDLYTINPDGTHLKNVTEHESKGEFRFKATVESVDELSYLYSTSWSPDGKSIVFVLPVGQDKKLFTIERDGKNMKALVTTKGDQFDPHWSK